MDIAPTVLKYFGLPIPGGHRWQAGLLDVHERARRPPWRAPRLAASPPVGGLPMLGCACRARAGAGAADRDRAAAAAKRDRGSAARAAARSGRARRAGTDAAGRAAQARGRARRSASSSWRRSSAIARTCSEAGCGRSAGGGARAGRRGAAARTSKRGSCSSTRWAAPATGGCCSNVDDLQALGRAYRTASAMTAIDRARVSEHYAHARCAGARAQGAAGARRGDRARSRPRPSRARAAADRAVAARTALVDVDRRPARPQRAARSASSQAAQQKLQASLAQIGGRPRRPRDPAAAAVPGRPALAGAAGSSSGRFGRQPTSRFGTAIVRNGMEICARRRSARPEHPRGHGRVCRSVRGLWQPRHRRSRRTGVFALRLSRRRSTSARGQRSRPQAAVGTGRAATPPATLRCTSSYASTARPVDPLQWLKKQP